MRWRHKLLMVLSGFGLAHMQNTTDLSPNCGLHLAPLRGAGEAGRLGIMEKLILNSGRIF